MGKKSHRLSVIKNLIESETISSQDELLLRLRELNIDTTQSTLSRDMKELRAVKVPNEQKGYIYLIPDNIAPTIVDKISSIVTANITDIDFSRNIGVIKTKPGYASAVAIMIDNEHYPTIIGTVAGDDHIMVVLREEVSKYEFLDSMKSIYPGIYTLYKPD